MSEPLIVAAHVAKAFLLAPEWRVVASTETMDGNVSALPIFAHWRDISGTPYVDVLVRPIVVEDARAGATRWQQTVVWHPRISPSAPSRLPSLDVIDYVKRRFVGEGREAYLVFPRLHATPPEYEWKVSLFTLLGRPDHVSAEYADRASALPPFYTLIPPLP